MNIKGKIELQKQVKEIYKLGKDITAYVPKNVKKQMDKKLKYKKGVQNGKEYDRPTHT